MKSKLFSVEAKKCAWNSSQLGLFATRDIPRSTIICLPYMGTVHGFDYENENTCYMFEVENVGIIDPSNSRGQLDLESIHKSENFAVFINEPLENQVSNSYFTAVDNFIVAVSWTIIPAGTEITAMYTTNSPRFERDYKCGSDPILLAPKTVNLPTGMHSRDFHKWCKDGFKMYESINL